MSAKKSGPSWGLDETLDDAQRKAVERALQLTPAPFQWSLQNMFAITSFVGFLCWYAVNPPWHWMTPLLKRWLGIE